MPSFIRSLPQFTPQEEDAITRLHRRRIETLQAVDRGVARLVTTLRFTKQLDNTYIIFTSDNGFHLGDHRLPGGKGTAYDTDIKVPLFVSGPGITAGASPAALRGQRRPRADARRPRGRQGRVVHRRPVTRAVAEGRSRRPRGARGTSSSTGTRPARKAVPPAPRKGTLEPDDLDAGKPGSLGPVYGKGPIDDKSLLARYGKIPDYSGVRTSRYLYVEYANGDRELYNVRDDPAETVNLAGTKPAVEASLARKLARLRDCRAQECRDADRGPVAQL